MIELEILQAIQIVTITEIEKEATEQWYQHICRWYSREFSTPLNEVEDMAEEKVLTIYFQDNFYKLFHSPEEDAEALWVELKHKLLLTEKEHL